jgi:formylmethanofuran dehydrogenase subunit E
MHGLVRAWSATLQREGKKPKVTKGIVCCKCGKVVVETTENNKVLCIKCLQEIFGD